MSLLSKLFRHPRTEAPPPPPPLVAERPPGPAAPAPPPVVEQPPPAGPPPVPDVTHRPAGDDPLSNWNRTVAVRTSRNEAWQALTTAERWGEWWAPVTDVEPGWTVGGRIHWADGGTGTITRVDDGAELAFADSAGNWFTFRLSDATDGRLRVTAFEDRATPLSMQGAFDRHNELVAHLSRLCTILEPPVPYAWRLELENGGDTGSNEGPVLWHETLYATAGNRVHAVGTDGHLRWTFAPGWAQNSEKLAVSTGVVVCKTLTDKVRAIDARTGELRWEVIPGPDYDAAPQSDAPEFDGARVYVRDRFGRIFCLSARDGAVVWWRLADCARRPVLAGGRLFVVGERLCALDAATGEELWAVDSDASQLGAPPDRDEIVALDRTAIVARDAATGEVRWEADLSAEDGYREKFTRPAFAGDDMFIRTGKHGVLCLDMGSRTVRWRFGVPGGYEGVYDEPAVGGGMVFCGLDDGLLHALDASTGEPLWSVSASMAEPVVVAGGRLYYVAAHSLCAVELHDIRT